MFPLLLSKNTNVIDLCSLRKASSHRERGAFAPTCLNLLVVFLQECVFRAVVVSGAEVGTDAVGGFAGGSGVYVQGGRAGLFLSTLKVCIVCI